MKPQFMIKYGEEAHLQQLVNGTIRFCTFTNICKNTPAYLFVAVLSCSCYVYAEICINMKSDMFINCHVHAYEYFGGVTRLLIPDNC